MKKYGFLLLMLAAFVHLNAQNRKNVDKGLLKVNALIPGISYEIGLGQNTTLNFDAMLIPGGRGGTDQETQLGILPGLQGDFRYFTNMGRRIGKGKNILGNSGNYVALTNQLYSGNALIGNFELDSEFNHIIALTYGIQRTRPKGFYWGVSFGPGLYTDDFDSAPILFIDLRLGWVLTKHR